MDFKEAMRRSLTSDKRTHTDPFLLHARISDLVGNDYSAKKAAEDFYRLDARFEISKTIIASVPARRKRRKKHVYRLKKSPTPPEDAYVFFTNDSETLHISRECSCLKNKTVYRTLYDYARYEDYLKRKGKGAACSSYNLSKTHKPHICRRCGGFSYKRANGFFRRLVGAIFKRLGIAVYTVVRLKSRLSSGEDPLDTDR